MWEFMDVGCWNVWTVQFVKLLSMTNNKNHACANSATMSVSLSHDLIDTYI